eukprot:TRINITY_DN10314_c0_g1_i2.p1 TRINITY_DN10314_c0_g1~~TRINITY_DN10314_c0_g1_i2.p1  ORF type:complete len:113 (+),score=18.04 TRINITY_DN10314_c0_g1_i2:155-493(+)
MAQVDSETVPSQVQEDGVKEEKNTLSVSSPSSIQRRSILKIRDRPLTEMHLNNEAIGKTNEPRKDANGTEITSGSKKHRISIVEKPKIVEIESWRNKDQHIEEENPCRCNLI